jgi:type II secretory pathway component PulF
VRRGGELTQALSRTHLFPQEFLHVIAVGEESGRLSEVLQQQAEHYQEESSRRMTILTWVPERSFG